jgi:hypothetical protein
VESRTVAFRKHGLVHWESLGVISGRLWRTTEPDLPWLWGAREGVRSGGQGALGERKGLWLGWIWAPRTLRWTIALVLANMLVLESSASWRHSIQGGNQGHKDHLAPWWTFTRISSAPASLHSL